MYTNVQFSHNKGSIRRTDSRDSLYTGEEHGKENCCAENLQPKTGQGNNFSPIVLIHCLQGTLDDMAVDIGEKRTGTLALKEDMADMV